MRCFSLSATDATARRIGDFDEGRQAASADLRRRAAR